MQFKNLLISVSCALCLVPAAFSQQTALPGTPDSAHATSTDLEDLSWRWFTVDNATFSARYRSAQDNFGQHTYEDGQQRTIFDGHFNLDAAQRYTVNFHVSSGHYFNWAYADVMGGGSDVAIAKELNFVGPYLGNELLPGVLPGAAQQVIAEKFPGLPPAMAAALLPAVEQQIKPYVLNGIISNFDTQVLAARSSTDSGGWAMYVRQLYFDAKPVDGVEFQYGSLGINRGMGTEATTYDDDGYIAGERLSFRMPHKVYFDEVSVTYGYLGDLFTPDFFQRGDRLMQSNYHQFLVRKKLNRRIEASTDYTFQSSAHTIREAAYVKVPETKIIDGFRFEAYQRVNRAHDYGRFYDAGSGFAVTGDHTFYKRYSLQAGYAEIDRNYTVYSQDPYTDAFGFAINGDTIGLGHHVIVRANVKVNSYVTLFGFYNHGFDGHEAPYNYMWNASSCNAGLTINMKKVASTALSHL